VAIIGAGITGLVTAHRLQELRPEWRIQIFDKGASPGGRMVSARPDPTGPVMELGAGRLHADKHINLKNLLAEFGIETQPYKYDCGEMRSQGGFSQAAHESCQRLLHYAESLSPTQKAEQSFFQGVRECLGPDEVTQLICALGYDALYHPSFPLEHGLDVLLNHPETPNRSRKEDNKWESLPLGFQHLAETIEAHLKSRCLFRYGHRLMSTQQVSGNGALPFRLYFDTDNGQCQVATRAVVCATHLRDLSAIKHPCHDGCMQTDHLVDVPCTKGYICHGVRWWQDLQLSGKCITTHLPFRKLYFPSSGRAFLFYSDSKSAVELNSVLTAGTGVPALIAEIKSCLPLTKQQQEQLEVYDCQWRFWPSGVSFWGKHPEPQTSYRDFDTKSL
jgi:hypothetical protein